MLNAKKEVVQKYFDAQNQSNAAAVVELFAKNAIVYNAAQPPVTGLEAIRAFCENLYSRTSQRSFTIINLGVGEDFIMAEWTAKMIFCKGASIGPLTLEHSFDVDIRGINKFEFITGASLIGCLRVYHETTTVMTLARANAKPL